jgi:hypothetical protein
MRKFFGALLLALAGTGVASVAHAAASATITLGTNTFMLSHTGFVGQQVGATGVRLPPLGSADYSFDYSISVRDDGLPATFQPGSTGCTQGTPVICSPPFTGFEIAQATLVVFFTDGRTLPGFIEITGDGTFRSLTTHGDSFAESLSESGTIHVHIVNHDPNFGFSRVFQTIIFESVVAVPEPAVVAQLLAGLAVIVIGLALRRRRG